MTYSNLSRGFVWLLMLSILLLCSLQSSAVETVQLTQSQAIFHTVTDPSVSPDGARVIFLARLQDPGIEHLYSAPVGGGPVTQLTETTENLQRVVDPTITNKGQRVVFRSNLDDPSVYQLYSVPITGGTVTQLNEALLPGGEVESDWQVSPNGQRVVFRAEQATAGVSDLYSVPTGGGVVTPLTFLPAQGDVAQFVISPDSSRVAVISDEVQDDVFTLKSLDIDGGLATVLSDPLVAGGDVVDAQFSPDSSTVLYRADQTVDEQFEIFTVPATGGPRTRMNDLLAADRDVINAAFTPTNGRVVFLTDMSTDDQFELYLALSNGPPNTKISDTLVSGGDVFSDWQIDPVTQRVLYRADQETDGVSELFSVTIAGGPSNKLNGPLQIFGDVLTGVQVHGERVFFRADDQEEGVQELFSTTLNGDDLVRLNDPILMELGFTGPGVRGSFQVFGDDVFFIAAQDSVVPQLFRVPTVGGTVTKVNSGDAFVREFLLSPDGAEAFYINDETAAGRNHLFQRTLAGLGPAIRLNDEPTSEIRGLVSEVQVTGDQTRMIYRASHLTASTDLLTQALSGGQAVKLSGNLMPGGRVERFRISPDGSQVVYVADQETIGTWEVYVNDVEGGALRKLSLPPSEGGAIAFPLADQPFTPDGSRVVYAAFQGPDPQCLDLFLDYQLYSVSTSNGTPVVLNDPLDTCTYTLDFEIGSTGERVVFVTLDWTDFTQELFSVPVAGGATVLLSDTLNVDGFQLTPDASRTVYSAEDPKTGQVGLYSIPTTGGSAVTLSEVVNSQDFIITRDGSRVVFRADRETADVFELFSVPVAGGAVTKISGDLVSGGDVHRFQLSPGLGRVVFTADKGTDGLNELYSVSVQGGEVSRLNQDLQIGNGLEVFEAEISADSSVVAFTLREIGTFNGIELYTVPLTGGVVHRVSLPLEDGEALGRFEVSDEGAYVLYLRQDEAFDFTYFRAPSRGGLAQRFSPAEIDARGAGVGGSWFSPDGSQLIFAGERLGTTSEELWLSRELDLFRDGFERGDTSAWSNQMP